MKKNFITLRINCISVQFMLLPLLSLLLSRPTSGCCTRLQAELYYAHWTGSHDFSVDSLSPSNRSSSNCPRQVIRMDWKESRMKRRREGQIGFLPVPFFSVLYLFTFGQFQFQNCGNGPQLPYCDFQFHFRRHGELSPGFFSFVTTNERDHHHRYSSC